jgi:hypothetical protein
MNKLTKLEKLYYNICRRLNAFYYGVKLLPFKIKRAISYAYVSWDLHDYDYSSGLIMLNYTFSRLEPLIKNGYNVNGEKLAKDLRILMEYIDRVKDHDDRYWYIMENFYAKYPNRPDFLFDQSGYMTFEKRTPEYRKELKRVFKQVDDLKNRDVEEMSRRMKKIRLYWD